MIATLFHPKFLVSFPRITFPETIKLQKKAFFRARKNPCMNCDFARTNYYYSGRRFSNLCHWLSDYRNFIPVFFTWHWRASTYPVSFVCSSFFGRAWQTWQTWHYPLLAYGRRTTDLPQTRNTVTFYGTFFVPPTVSFQLLPMFVSMQIPTSLHAQKEVLSHERVYR